MKNKFSPGPWRLVNHAGDHSQGIVSDERDYDIALVYNRYEEEYQANADLMAAAPELLEALENLVRWQDTGNNPPLASDWRKAREAIRKAKEGSK